MAVHAIQGNAVQPGEGRNIKTRISIFLLATVLLGLLTVSTSAIRAQGEPGTESDPLVARSYVDQFVQLQVVSLEAGQRLEAEAGAELILRAGKAEAIGSKSGGIADLTAGNDVQSGQLVAPNHLLLVPRTDGRGLKALTSVVVLVRGPFVVR